MTWENENKLRIDLLLWVPLEGEIELKLEEHIGDKTVQKDYHFQPNM